MCCISMYLVHTTAFQSSLVMCGYYEYSGVHNTCLHVHLTRTLYFPTFSPQMLGFASLQPASLRQDEGYQAHRVAYFFKLIA